MNETKKKGHGGLIALVIIVLLLAAVCAAPFVINAATYFVYDDYETLAEGWERLFDLSPAGDGEHLLFHMDRNGIYRLMIDNDVLSAVEEETGGKVRVEQIGYLFRAGADELEVHAAVKALGFLPAQLRALADVAVEGDSLHITPREVWYGNRIRVSPEKLAQWTGMPELTEGFTVSLADYTKPLRADAVYLEGEGVTIASPLLAEVIDAVAEQNETEVRLLRLYYGDDTSAARVLRGEGRAEYIRAAGKSYEALSRALGDVCAYGSDEYRRGLIHELSGFPVYLTAGLQEFPGLRQAQLERAAEAQATYGEAQLALRTDYWYKNVILAVGCLKGMEGTPLEERLPADWEARVVLMYNANYDAIVKTSEGNPRLQVPIPGLPMLSELPRESWDALPRNDNGPFDLTLALRLPSGTPAVVFLTPEDEFGLAVLTEEQFAEIKAREDLPIVAAGELISADRSAWLRVTGLREDLPPANYIGVP